jgi:hypothetical protein
MVRRGRVANRPLIVILWRKLHTFFGASYPCPTIHRGGATHRDGVGLDCGFFCFLNRQQYGGVPGCPSREAVGWKTGGTSYTRSPAG